MGKANVQRGRVKKKKRRWKRRIIHRHHISYTPELITFIYGSEHDVLTKIRRLLKSKPSEGFIDQLELEYLKTRFKGDMTSEKDMEVEYWARKEKPKLKQKKLKSR